MYTVANNQFRGICDSSDFLFQDDNASCHRSKQVKGLLNQNRNSPIKTINWPANSPDLNPIEMFGKET